MVSNLDSDFKRRLLNWLRNQQDVFMFNSCAEDDVQELGSYDLVIGVGIQESVEMGVNDHLDLDRLKKFANQSEWRFFAVSYDFKNALHRLKSQKEDVLQWPLFSMVKPVHVITLTKDNTWEVFSDQREQLLKDITDTPVEDIKPPLNVTFSRSRQSMTRDQHYQKVEYIKKQIEEGNLYEMNLCMETVLEDFACTDMQQLYERLIDLSPTPFSAFVKLSEKHLICASPERFITKHDGRIYSQPIKGTSERHDDEAKDKISRIHLANSLKERAEHIMIVDLVRNDLSKVSIPGSVSVDELFGIYGYRQVNQMISTISGELRENTDLIDCLLAAYPMGSMTGAPKHITMEFIDNIETASRGWYSGTVGYIKPNGDFDSNVIIRSLLYDDKKKVAKFAVGGAITYDSDPVAEYEECLLKSSAVRQILGID